MACFIQEECISVIHFIIIANHYIGSCDIALNINRAVGLLWLRLFFRRGFLPPATQCRIHHAHQGNVASALRVCFRHRDINPVTCRRRNKMEVAGRLLKNSLRAAHGRADIFQARFMCLKNEAKQKPHFLICALKKAKDVLFQQPTG